MYVLIYLLLLLCELWTQCDKPVSLKHFGLKQLQIETGFKMSRFGFIIHFWHFDVVCIDFLHCYTAMRTINVLLWDSVTY